jgi:hypothetical protein
MKKTQNLPKIGDFKYQLELTEDLDNLNGDYSFTFNDLYKITLWKVSRFPIIKPKALDALNNLANYASLNAAKDAARVALTELLECKGVRLAMASTYLRFRNPKVFQIIDQRVWRNVKKWDKKNANILKDYPDSLTDCTRIHSEQIELYFSYLETLRSMCQKDGQDFEYADRVYYIVDKKEGNPVDNYGSNKRNTKNGVTRKAKSE